MKLLGDVAHVESCFGTFREVLVSEQGRCSVCAKPTISSEIVFRRTQWYSCVTRFKWKLISFYLEIVLILTQDRCTVCAERSIGMEIMLDTPEGTPR
jgi:hypothetical protein